MALGMRATQPPAQASSRPSPFTNSAPGDPGRLYLPVHTGTREAVLWSGHSGSRGFHQP